MDLEKKGGFFTFIVNQNYREDILKNIFSWPPTPRYSDGVGSGWGLGMYIYSEVPDLSKPLRETDLAVNSVCACTGICLVTPLSLVPNTVPGVE